MFDFIKRLFGEGYIYSTFDAKDITTGKVTTGKGRQSYIGDIETFDEKEFIRQLQDEAWFKYNKVLSNVKVWIREQ